MGRSRLDMLSRDDMQTLDDASVRILQESGAIVRSEAARTMLRKAGTKVVESEMRVYFGESIVRDAVKTAAREIVLGARDRRHDLKIPNREFPFISTDGFAVQIRDSATGEKRPSLRSDLEKWATIVDAVDSVDFLWPSIGATELPPHTQLIGGLRTCYERTTKHVQYQAFSGPEASLEIEMARAVAGGDEENRRRPHFSSIQCIVAPLQFDEGSTDAVMEFARAGVPVVAMTMVSPGITGPTTLAGSIALSNAEVLASVVISQLASRGAPIFYCTVCAPLDMKSGNFATGSPEYGLLSVAGAEMARFYDLPSMMGGMGTSAKAPGAQVGYEKAITSLPVALSGCDLFTGCGGLGDASFMSMEQLLIDSQVWDDIHRAAKGIEVSDKEIAMDVILKAGPKGQYLALPHTFANFRRLHAPRYSDRASYMAWEAAGKKDLTETVSQEVERILATHKAEPLPGEIATRLEEIESRAAKLLG